jgi:hypothetical protein
MEACVEFGFVSAPDLQSGEGGLQATPTKPTKKNIKGFSPGNFTTTLSRVDPIGFESRGSNQSLHNDTIPFRLFLQTAQLLWRCLRRINVESEPDLVEANRDIRCNTERASKIQISFDGHLDTFRPYSHGCGHHLASKLCAGRQSAEQQIAGTSGGTRSSYPGVSFGIIDGAPDRNRAGNRGLGLSTLSFKSDPRGGGIIPVLFLQRFLNRLKIHGGLRERAHQCGIVASLRAC